MSDPKQTIVTCPPGIDWPPKVEEMVAYSIGPDGERTRLPDLTVKAVSFGFIEWRGWSGEEVRAGYWDDDGNEVVTHPWQPDS